MDAAEIKNNFKDVCSQLAAGVTVITVKSGDSESECKAMTATAFMPLSLDPPLILVAIEKKNDTHEIFNGSDCIFGVSLLAENQSEISTRYSKKDPDRYHFEGIDTFTGPNGSVLISGSVAAIEAEVSNKHDAGDHTIFVGQISWLKAFEGGQPLIYWNRGYQSVSKLGA